jgi:hypothetical protein
MKRWVWPVGHALDVVVLERIDVDIIDVTKIVILAAYPVLPMVALPDSSFAGRHSDRRAVLGLGQCA